MQPADSSPTRMHTISPKALKTTSMPYRSRNSPRGECSSYGMPWHRFTKIRAKLPDGFFLWVHVMTPHYPWLPDAADRGRFLPDAELQSFKEEENDARWQPYYAPDQQ